MSDDFNDELTSDSFVENTEDMSEDVAEDIIEEVKEEAVEETPDFVTESEDSIENLVSFAEPEVVIEPVPFLGSGVNGTISSMSASKKPSSKKKISKVDEKAYLISERGLFINGVGRLWKGFNVVPKKYEDKWLSLSGVRKATKEEIDKEYGR
jgi:hypothetical protein